MTIFTSGYGYRFPAWAAPTRRAAAVLRHGPACFAAAAVTAFSAPSAMANSITTT
ncbi:hypothetical protein [Nocardia sp. NPDC051570]|uniref:hypothetical protein n=1 Tax=Nocardia sp. NPDC051570 TaxID=3364324 RepID=UPI00378DAF18